MTKPRYVFDTNIIISAALFSRSITRQAFDKALIHGNILVSEDIFNELSEVIQREKFDKYISLEERLAFFDDLKEILIVVEIKERIQACRDPKDDKVLEVAVNGQAFAIVTGDKDLLVLNPFREIAILTAREFLDSFNEDDKA